MLLSTSADEGESWSFAEDTAIPNLGSSLEVIVLKNGHWVMAYNDTGDGRHSRAVSLSEDEGSTWKWERHVGQAEGDDKSFSYPSLIQSKDGMLHLTYSYREKGGRLIKHAVFSEKWVREVRL